METKRYFSKIAGSKFIFPDGREIYFNHGFYDLKEEDFVGQVCNINSVNGQAPDSRHGKPLYQVYREELDGLIKVGNPLLYVQGSQPEPLPSFEADKSAKTEGEVATAEARMRGLQSTEMGELNKGVVGITDPNASTVDPSLRGLVLAERKPVGTESLSAGAARIAAARQAAAQKGTSSNS